MDAFERSTRFNLLLSFAAGTSIAYVALHLMPHLANESSELPPVIIDFFGHHDIAIYAVVLIGILIYFGMRTLAVTPNHQQQEVRDIVFSGAFIFSITMFSIANISIGHLMHERAALGYEVLFLFALAIALHYIVINFNLSRNHGDSYIRYGRWVLVLAIIVGWLLGYMVNLSRGWFAMLMAFIIGGIILNTLKLELPENSRNTFLAFVAGALIYGAFILVVM